MRVAALLAASGLTPVEPASPNAQDIADLYWFVTFFAVAIFLVVTVPLVIFIVRYRRRGRARDEEGPQIRGNTNLEIAWTAGPVVIIVLIAIFTFYKLPGLSLEAEAGPQELTVDVSGRQFYWEYRYPNGVIAINNLVAPADRPVRLRISAPDDDVIHSYWVPALFGKQDAIPGQSHEIGFKGKEGTYVGQCAEFCGLQHAAMLNSIELIPPTEFDGWLSEQATAQQAGRSDLGRQQFEGVCATCHGDQGQGLIGPAFTAANVATPASVERVVREGGVKMPPVGKGWTPEQMKALTDYLRQRFGQEAPSG